MRININKLKILYLTYVVSRTANNRDSCPSPYSMLKTIMAAHSLRKKKRLIEHISECSSCLEDFSLLLKIANLDTQHFSKIIKQVQEHSSTIRPSFSLLLLSNFMKYAIIMTSLILLIISFTLVLEKEAALTSLRSKTERIQLIDPGHIHKIARPLIFNWTKHPKAKYYVLELFNDEMLPIWTSPNIKEISYYLSDEILKKLEIDKRYFWIIKAFSSTEELAKSNLASFILR